MITFLIGLLILLAGYLTYSKYIEKQFGPEDRKMPCETLYNGVDYVPLSARRNEFINILNIAGMFYIFIISSFIFNAKIGFNLSLNISEILAVIVMAISLWAIMRKCRNYEGE
ncbi:MAG: hypothetical protein K6C94_05095 [Candidatus Gastranaerophilales bacterium]|nr:hypothetical protein [Candidatus Gastranaerophilales bacterium]